MPYLYPYQQKTTCPHCIPIPLASILLLSIFQYSEPIPASVLAARQALLAMRVARLEKSGRPFIQSTLDRYKTAFPRKFTEISWFLDQLKVPVPESIVQRGEEGEKGRAGDKDGKGKR